MDTDLSLSPPGRLLRNSRHTGSILQEVEFHEEQHCFTIVSKQDTTFPRWATLPMQTPRFLPRRSLRVQNLINLAMKGMQKNISRIRFQLS
jgi:hypothetical protein